MKSLCLLLLAVLLLADDTRALFPILEVQKNGAEGDAGGKVIRVKRAPLGKLALLAGGASLLGKKALLLGGAVVGVKVLAGAGLVGATLYKVKNTNYGSGYVSEYNHDAPSVYGYVPSTSWD